jgi:hypothetical protein
MQNHEYAASEDLDLAILLEGTSPDSTNAAEARVMRLQHPLSAFRRNQSFLHPAAFSDI